MDIIERLERRDETAIELLKGIEKRITKQDFYNENYDHAF